MIDPDYKCERRRQFEKQNIYKKDYMYAMWVPYLIGTLIALCGILAIYVSIVELKKEKATLMSKGGYSYLKK